MSSRGKKLVSLVLESLCNGEDEAKSIKNSTSDEHNLQKLDQTTITTGKNKQGKDILLIIVSP